MEFGYIGGGNKLVETVEKLSIRCWLCGKPVEIKFTVKEKPYLVCDTRNGGCGMQVFLREPKAIQLLQDKVRREMQRE